MVMVELPYHAQRKMVKFALCVLSRSEVRGEISVHLAEMQGVFLCCKGDKTSVTYRNVSAFGFPPLRLEFRIFSQS